MDFEIKTQKPMYYISSQFNKIKRPFVSQLTICSRSIVYPLPGSKRRQRR